MDLGRSFDVQDNGGGDAQKHGDVQADVEGDAELEHRQVHGKGIHADGLADAEPPEEGDLSGQLAQERAQKDAAQKVQE